MSAFSSVDEAPDPQRLVRFLDGAAVGLGAMKHYVAAAHALRRPTKPVLDLGCGAGHDLELLRSLGVRAIGIDPSRVMADTAAARTPAPLVQGDGAALPFADAAFAGCRIERVLMHVDDPAAVIAEVVRCVEPGGLVTINEPDWSTLATNGDPVPIRWVSVARHPAVGGVVGELLEAAGCRLLDRVEERSWWTFDDLVTNTNLEPALDRAVAVGHVGRDDVDDWLATQRRRADAGTFRAEFHKVLWVATTPR